MSAPSLEHADALRMRGIRKRFGATQALDGVDLDAARGEVLALVGENGAGKSTLMRVLAGVCPPDAGEMWLDGRPFQPRTPQAARRAGVMMVHQELALAPHLSVAENMLLGVEPARGGLFLRRGELQRRGATALAQVGLENVAPDTRTGDLPPAVRQLVEIGRALAVGCRVLVLDEPTSSLAVADVRRLFDLLRRLRSRGHTILYISHVLEEVREIADRFLVLRDGRSVGGGVTAAVSADEIIAQMVGRTVTELYPRSPRTPGETVLSVSGLAGAGRPLAASLEVRRGEVVGIAGLVGAGRTEFLRALFGLDPIRRGEVRLLGAAGPAAPGRRWRQGAGMVSEDRKEEGVAAGLSIADNITLPRLRGLGPPGCVLRGRQRCACAPWLERLQIKCRGTAQACGELSGGNQQKVALARLLQSDAELLLLDEPTRGIDVGAKAQIYRMIDELAVRGKAVLVVSSYLPELLGVCDRIAVMCRGRLGAALPVAAWDERKIVAAATGGEAK